MNPLARLNGVIDALARDEPVFLCFAAPEPTNLAQLATSDYHGVVIEMEHSPYDARLLRDCLQYMLDRRQLVERGVLGPAVTPLVRLPVNGAEQNQWLVKQALGAGAYGIVFPQVSTVEEAYSAVAACRYRRPADRADRLPAGVRGDGPSNAARYWGVDQQEYYRRADVWPLAPQGEVLVVIQCEERRAITNLPRMLAEVPGIGAVLVGEGDLSQDLGHPRQYEHPDVRAAVVDILAICRDAGVACGYPHATEQNIPRLLEEGFDWLMPAPARTYSALELARSLTQSQRRP